MHYLVKLIVEAPTSADALVMAERDADELVERGDFDWYTLKGRWGDSKACGVNSQKGKILIKQGMEANRQQFDDALKHIRYMLQNYSEEEIYNEDFRRDEKLPDGLWYISRYNFTLAGGGPNAACVYAVDSNLWGSRIDNDKDLKVVLSNKGDRKLWVVPVDFHS